VHAREVLNERPRIVFCGNLQGRHAKETGAKGCELVTVEAGRIEAEFIALDVVRWSQLSVPLDGVDRLESLNEAFARALEPVLGRDDGSAACGARDADGIDRVAPVGGGTAGHARGGDACGGAGHRHGGDLDRAGTAGSFHPAGSCPGCAAPGCGGELVRLVDTIAGDDQELMRRAQVELGDLLGAMPAEVTAGDVPRLDDPAELRSLLMDAEATVLARLSASGRRGMKLARLLLLAFGPFTNKTLDFSTGSGNLHLIYGPNEAGKSSALRAMTDLRFGIPLRSPDDFVHPAGELRIGGVFIDQAGRPVGLIRRKGRGTTLSGLDVRTEQTDPGFAVDSRLERELTGGLERQEFEAMFGLNHARLREGGAVLLSGEGDLGSALFEASAGTSGIAALLAALDGDAKKLYSQHGRAQNAVINEARRQLDEQRKAWREAQTKPAEWQALNRAHETAKAALDDPHQGLGNVASAGERIDRTTHG
jgi:hypothetical protein